MKIDNGLLERFWDKVKKTPSCWEWQAGKINGYGRIGLTSQRRCVLAHRLSYEIHYGPIADGMCVLHRCDTPGCVRPDHLFLGTVGDNNRDRAKKGRNRSVKGEAHGRSKITVQDVCSIRQKHKDGRTVASLARE